MQEKEPPNNVISFEEYRKRKDALLAEVQGAIQTGLEDIGYGPEQEFKFFTEIYSSLLQTFARKFADLGEYDLGSKSYDRENSSMLLTFSFTEKKFADFLDFLEKHFNFIPRNLKEKITVYVGEHDNFLDSPAAKLSERFERIADSEKIPIHEEDSLDYNEREYENAKDVGLKLRDKLRQLLEIE